MSSTVKKIFIAWVKDYNNIIVHASKKYWKRYIQKYLGSKNKKIFPTKPKYKHTYIESLINFVYKIIYNNYYYFLRKINDNVISAQCLFNIRWHLWNTSHDNFALCSNIPNFLPSSSLSAASKALTFKVNNNK